MPKKIKPASPDVIRAKADRAEAVSRGEEPSSLPTVLDPPEVAAVMGRPTKYEPRMAEQAAKLCGLGATDVDLADFFNVNVRTVQRWVSEHEDFCRAIKAAKEIADDRVERSLYQRAVGYTFDAVKIMTSGGKEMIVPYREHVVPDVTAQIFWLKNRRKDQWRDRTEQEVTHKHSLSQEFESLIREVKGLPDHTRAEDATIIEHDAA